MKRERESVFSWDRIELKERERDFPKFELKVFVYVTFDLIP